MSLKPRAWRVAPIEADDIRRQVNRLIRKLTRPLSPGLSRDQEQFEAARDLAKLGTAARRAIKPLLRGIDGLLPHSQFQQYPSIRSVRHFAVALSFIGGAEVVVPLLERRSDECLRRVGCLEKAVAAIGEEAAGELIAALDHQLWYVREGAALALGLLGHQPAVELLIGQLGDTELAVARAAAAALGQIGDPRAVAPLLALYRRTRSQSAKRRIAVALDSCGYRPDSPVDPVNIDVMVSRDDRNGLAALGVAAVPYLLEVARDPDSFIRSSTMTVLGRIGDRRTIPVFLRGLGDRYRHSAVEGLGLLAEPRAVEPLLELLEEQLAGKPSPISALMAEALGRIGDPRAVDLLRRALAESHLVELRCKAATALGQLGAVEAAGDLRALLDQPSLELRAAAAAALDRLIPAADVTERVKRMIAAGDWPGLIAAGKAVVAPILATLREQPEKVQPELVKVMGRIADQRAAPAVIDWLFDHPASITEARALEEWVEALCRLLRDYARIILSLAAAARRKKVDESTGYHDEYHWKYDHGWIDRGLRDLASIEGPVAVDLLHRVANKPDPTVETGYYDGEMWAGPMTGKLSFARQRARAARELARRGDPPVDPAALTRPGAFRRQTGG